VPSLRYYYVLQRVPSLESSLSYNILYIYSYVLYGSIKLIYIYFFWLCVIELMRFPLIYVGSF
jgi:hypothetical protein